MSTNTQLKVIETYWKLLNINGISHALRAAFRLGIITALEGGQKTAEEIATECGLQLAPTQLILESVRQTDLIEKYGDDYALSQTARMIPVEFRDLGDRYWRYLEHYAKTGVRLPSDEDTPIDDSDFYAESAAAEWMVTPAAMEAISILDFPTTRSSCRILDVGAGSAVLGMAILHHDPTSRLTVLDTENGIKRARKTSDSINKTSNVEFIEADYRAIEIEANQFDLVILENVLHRENSEEVLNLLSKARATLREDGEIVIIDVFPGQSDGDVARSLFELSVNMRLSSGELHSPDSMRELLQKSGFDKLEFAHLNTPPFLYGLLVGRRI